MSCVFCQIADHEIPTQFLYEDDEIMAFDDLHPKAKVHFLVLPKVHLTSLAATRDEHGDILGRLLLVAKKIATKKGIDKTGYKTIINTGNYGGQAIPHLHIHVLGGEKLHGIT